MSKVCFDKAELFDMMLFSPLFWFDRNGSVVAAFANTEDAWRWACINPDDTAHPFYFGSSISANHGRPAGDLTRMGYDWFAGWCVGKAIALVK